MLTAANFKYGDLKANASCRNEPPGVAASGEVPAQLRTACLPWFLLLEPPVQHSSDELWSAACDGPVIEKTAEEEHADGDVSALWSLRGNHWPSAAQRAWRAGPSWKQRSMLLGSTIFFPFFFYPLTVSQVSREKFVKSHTYMGVVKPFKVSMSLVRTPRVHGVTRIRNGL